MVRPRSPVAGRTLRAVLMVAGGTVVAQVIAAAATPILTRLYGPEPLGALATVLAYAGIVGPVAGLCLPIAIVLAQGVEEVGDLKHAARMLALPCGIATAIAAPFFLDGIGELGVPGSLLGAAVLLLIVSSVWVQVSQQQIIRASDYRLLGLLTVGQAIIFVAVQLGAGLLHPDPSLLIAVSSGYSLFFLLLAVASSSYRTLGAVPRSGASMWDTMRRFSDFPRYRAPQVMINALGAHLPTLLLAALVDVRWAGLFMVTQRILTLPVMFVGKSISDVIYPQVVQLVRAQTSSYPLLKTWTVAAAVISTPIAALLLAVGQPLFAFVLGEQWTQAGLLAQSMTPWMVAALVCRPAVGAIPALELQRAYLVSDAVTTVAKSVVLVLMLSSGAAVWMCFLIWSLLSAGGLLWIAGAVLVKSRRQVGVLAR